MQENNKRHHWLSIKDILDLKQWKKIQDNFSAITGVCLRTVDLQGNAITPPSNEPQICEELTKKSTTINKLCGNCLPTFLGGKAIIDKNLSFNCLPGVHNFLAPLKLNAQDEALGYLIIGPVILVMRKPKEEYLKVAEELGLDSQYLWNSISEIKVVSFQGIQSLVELIKDVGDYTLKSSYQRLLQERELNTSSEIPKIGKLWESLLEVAFQLSGADIGSIMSFDKLHDELTIKVSRGIPEDIVRTAKVKLGDGISGMAAKEGRSLLINEDIDDNRIRPYLNRPSLGSSMILPLKAKNRIVGVMNLGALKTSSARFSLDNLNLMDKLADLASVAIV